MGIFKWLWAITKPSRSAASDLETRVLDGWIHDALIDDAFAQLPSGAWEKLCKAIIDRKPVKSYGMWVLDEPFRDPPEVLPTVLSGHEFERVRRIQDEMHFSYQFHSIREAMWSSLPPQFAAIVNW